MSLLSRCSDCGSPTRVRHNTSECTAVPEHMAFGGVGSGVKGHHTDHTAKEAHLAAAKAHEDAAAGKGSAKDALRATNRAAEASNAVMGGQPGSRTGIGQSAQIHGRNAAAFERGQTPKYYEKSSQQAEHKAAAASHRAAAGSHQWRIDGSHMPPAPSFK